MVSVQPDTDVGAGPKLVFSYTQGGKEIINLILRICLSVLVLLIDSPIRPSIGGPSVTILTDLPVMAPVFARFTRDFMQLGSPKVDTYG